MVRKTKQPSDMNSLMNQSSGTLAQLTAKTNSLTKLSDIVRQICPDLPVDVWHIANFRQNFLIIEVKSSVWSQRLQFERVKISQEIAKVTQGEFDQIEIKVSPFGHKKVEASKVKKEKPLKQLSQHSAEQLMEVAQGAPKGLKEKLERLASLANRNK